MRKEPIGDHRISPNGQRKPTKFGVLSMSSASSATSAIQIGIPTLGAGVHALCKMGSDFGVLRKHH
jgi:hypothetical protein